MYPDKWADFGSTICGKLALNFFVSLQLVYLGQHFLSPLTRNPIDLSILDLSEETELELPLCDGCVVLLKRSEPNIFFSAFKCQ